MLELVTTVDSLVEQLDPGATEPDVTALFGFTCR
jgi:hypothetical protein